MRITVRHTYIIITLSLLARVFAVSAASPGQIAGRVVDSRSGEAICGAVAGIEGTYRWAVTDRDGRFSLGTAPASKELKLSVSYLGYVTRSVMLDPHGDLSHLEIRLTENTLAIDEVVVTARRKAEEPSSAYVIERHALDHLQMSNVADVAALLPGGKTVNPDLTSDSRMSLRTGGQSIGNAAFGTAVEVDGVRLSDNASFGAMNSVGTRNIAVADIESVEIITGLPSDEYGDVISRIV
ncbi:MAG: TonB-dependent receptor [Alistipes sp.]|nr:TonB-dependent receptor [Alistipes sp.]